MKLNLQYRQTINSQEIAAWSREIDLPFLPPANMKLWGTASGLLGQTVDPSRMSAWDDDSQMVQLYLSPDEKPPFLLGGDEKNWKLVDVEDLDLLYSSMCSISGVDNRQNFVELLKNSLSNVSQHLDLSWNNEPVNP